MTPVTHNPISEVRCLDELKVSIMTGSTGGRAWFSNYQ